MQKNGALHYHFISVPENLIIVVSPYPEILFLSHQDRIIWFLKYYAFRDFSSFFLPSKLLSNSNQGLNVEFNNNQLEKYDDNLLPQSDALLLTLL